MADGARKRALRAARVATLGLVLATPGCCADHSGPDDRDASYADAAIVDAGPGDAGPIDDAAVADAGTCSAGGDDWVACCEAIGWDWNRGGAAWGPCVPPGEVA